ncbi:MAG: type III polyketide synthase [Planctomycetota bacterium]|jgi:predicted naringenin-chalcone synthase
MSVYIQSIACQVPETSYSQSFIQQRMKRRIGHSRRASLYIDGIYKDSGIDKRHSVIADPDSFFKPSGNGHVTVPTTKQRNDLFAEFARKMFVDLAEKVIAGCENADFDKITHVVTVSCTGFFNPGPDYEIVKQVGLSKDVQRFNLGFMGCYGAFPALRLASTICRADPGATVLIVAVELCTLHAQLAEDLDSILGGALFADGGAAVIVSAATPRPGQSTLALEGFTSTVIPDSEGDMAWTIGDTGFEMVLSQYIPKIIERNISEIVLPLLDERGVCVSDIRHWAVHPGGKSILDKIEASLGIENRLEESRSVLRRFGNMSSATVLFVLKEILSKPSGKSPEPVLAMAFGPGLTAEMGFMSMRTASAAGARSTATFSAAESQ